jgi:hypothetical protein
MSESVDGKAIDQPPPSKDSQGKYWKANYHLRDDESFESVFKLIEVCVDEIECAQYFFGEEHGKSGNTRHIEGGFVTRGDRVRWSKIQSCFEKAGIRMSYLAKSKKAWLSKNIAYAFKEGNSYIKSDNVSIPEVLVKMTKDLLRPGQLEIADMFREREHPLWGRKIFWFWEPKGNWGKSVLVTYMIDQMEAMEVSGKGADVLCGISSFIEKNERCPPIVVYDVPRSTSEYVSYQSIEKIKDGKFFSGKYESGMVRYNKPHVIVFANCRPDLEKLSADRWVVKCLLSDEELNEFELEKFFVSEDE